MKRDIIKALKARGIRYAEKKGVGRVNYIYSSDERIIGGTF